MSSASSSSPVSPTPTPQKGVTGAALMINTSDELSTSTDCPSPEDTISPTNVVPPALVGLAGLPPLTDGEQTLCRQLLVCDFEDHKLVTHFTVLGASVKLLKKEKQGSSLLQYVASGTMPISAETLIALNVDNEYRSVWDENCLETTGLSRVNEYTEALYSVTKYPAPLSKRDYVYHRRVMQFDNAIVMASTAASTPAVPETWRKVRISSFQSITVIRPVSETSCQLSLLYFEDPRAVVPNFVVNWITATALPNIIRKTIEAASNYPQHRLSSVFENVPRLDIHHWFRQTTTTDNNNNNTKRTSHDECVLRDGYGSLRQHLYSEEFSLQQ
eukprot:GHVS01020555.1.p1 GENE.GHVS01020555.1~~GHVS01020555.1.p1  ORF type:complete len:330 (-),score=37.19 GHVS01020555.1:20-1009(-)